MKKKTRKRILALLCVLALSITSVTPVMACTPPLKPPSVEIPDITFQPDDALKEAIASSLLRQWSMHRTIKASQGILTTVTWQSSGRKLKMQRPTKCVSQKLMEHGKNTIRPIQHFTLPITLMILLLMGWTELQ